ncbi:MAG: dienelactone hydrolase family protein [Hyphomicrobiaceae bacterium]|nr:dienelactone hydrolase family protein [Hyphomicrobiaceae bacterium]
MGPSNLETLLATIPSYWAAFFEVLARIGDRRTQAGCALLRERSPLRAAGAIAKTLQIGEGANDPRVKQAASDQIITAMRAKGTVGHVHALFEEGHGFAVAENRLSLFAIAEAFLAGALGRLRRAHRQRFRRRSSRSARGLPRAVRAKPRWPARLPPRCHQGVATWVGLFC